MNIVWDYIIMEYMDVSMREVSLVHIKMALTPCTIHQTQSPCLAGSIEVSKALEPTFTEAGDLGRAGCPDETSK